MSDQLDLMQDQQEMVGHAVKAVPALFQKLRDYQQESIGEIRRIIREYKERGEKGVNIMLCSPTGSGKTAIGSYIIWQTANNMKRSNYIVDRINLVDQTADVFDALGIPFGVNQAQHWKFRPWERVQLCSAQTLARRQWPEGYVNVIDEAHTVHTVVRKKLEKRDAINIGLSATPFTRGLGLLYDELINVTTTNKLIADGFLAPYRIFAPSAPDMTGVKVVGGEWEEKETSKRAMKIVGDCVAEYIKHANGRKFICRGVDVEHVEELHRQFMEAGIMCGTYTYKDKDEDRKEFIREFRKHDSLYRGIITVSAATKGFDVPDIGCVIDARPLRKSLSEVIQFFGRGARISPETGKTDFIVLDHSGNLERFWDEIMEFFEHGCLELNDGRKPETKDKPNPDQEPTMMKCPTCHHLHAAMPFCPQCGYEYKRVSKSVQHEAGTLSEMLATGDKKTIAKKLWPQIVHWAQSKTTDTKTAEKKALAMFKNITGEWPTQGFSSTIPITPQPDVLNKIKSLQIAFAKSQQAKNRAIATGKPGALFKKVV